VSVASFNRAGLQSSVAARLGSIAADQRLARLWTTAPSEPMRRSLETSDVRVRTSHRGATLTGYAAVFNTLSVPTSDAFGINYRESIRPGAFAGSLASGQEIIALWNHDKNVILASTRNGSLRLWEDERGLAFEMTPIDSATVRNYILPSIEDGRIYGMSFSFRPVRETWSADRRTHTVFEAELLEVSPVVYPAYPSTSVTVTGSASRSVVLRTPAKSETGYRTPEQRRSAAARAMAQAIDDAPHERARRAAIEAEALRRVREREERWARARSLAGVSLGGF